MKLIKSTHGVLTENRTLEFEGTIEEFQEVKHLFADEELDWADISISSLTKETD